MLKIFALIYGFMGWAGFMGVFLYMVGFLGNFLVPKSVNSGIEGSAVNAFLINLILIGLFGLHHSICARPWFKKKIHNFIPAHLERSTYVNISNILMILLYVYWQPMKGLIWHVQNPMLYGGIYLLFGIGWMIVVLSSFMINHFDLLGLRQVFLYALGKPYVHIPFRLSFLYKLVRHPIMLGWFIAFWATPTMTQGHLLFAVGMTLYGLIGIHFEERNLKQYFGEDYLRYQQTTPALIPFLKGRARAK